MSGEEGKCVKRKMAATTESEPTTKVKQKVLEEEEYLSVLEKIIERDFYPELSKLRLRTSYLEALSSNDLEKLRQIQLALEESGTPFNDGSFTPLPKPTTTAFDGDNPADSLQDTNINIDSNLVDSSKKFVDSRLTLDKFLIQNTSEDNASFDNIIEATREKQRQLHAWLYPHEEGAASSSTKMITVGYTGKDRKLIEMKDRPNTVETWPYVVKNDFMYDPAGLPLTQKEREEKRLNAKEIHHENTRFRGDPFDANAFKTTMQEAAKERERLNKIMKKVGVDGELENMTSTSTQSTNAPEYERFVDTPSPQPGVDCSPLMTWGAIEGTPIHIASTPGPKFKIHDIQRREQIAITLADKVGKRHREERKKAAAKAATSAIFTPKETPRLIPRTAERVSKLTPAAQKLMKKASSSIHRDESLRASYTPTPSSTGKKKSGSSLTPSMKTPGTATDGTRTPGSVRGSSITDNMLNIPPS